MADIVQFLIIYWAVNTLFFMAVLLRFLDFDTFTSFMGDIYNPKAKVTNSVLYAISILMFSLGWPYVVIKAFRSGDI